MILTEVLAERQDVQAKGRCGRADKSGVIQYQILDGEDNGQFTGVQRLLNLQLAKSSNEEIELLAKEKRIAEGLCDGDLLQWFVDWKVPYKEQWMSMLFPKDAASAPQEVSLKAAMEKWLEAFIVERWAYWRTMGSGFREQGDGLVHFRNRAGMKEVVALDLGQDHSDSMTLFLKRLLNFAAYTRLDAEQLFSLSIALLQLATQEPAFLYAVENLLNKATGPDPGWQLYCDELWQPEWTGNAALLLAAVRCKLPSFDDAEVISAFKRAEESVDLLIRKLHLQDSGSRNLKLKLDDVKEKGVEKPQMPQDYLIQYREMIKQLEYRKKVVSQLSQLQGSSIQTFNLEHLSAAPSVSKVHAHFLGYTWAKVVFEFYPSSSPIFTASSKEFIDWKQNQEKRVEELSSADQRDVQDRTGGGAGGDADMKARSQGDEWAQLGSRVVLALRMDLSQQSDQLQKDQQEINSQTLRDLSPAPDMVKQGRAESFLWSRVKQEKAERQNLSSKLATEQQGSKRQNLQKAIADAFDHLATSSRGIIQGEKALGAEVEKKLSGEIDGLLRSIYTQAGRRFWLTGIH